MNRIKSIDLLRGIAVLGILIMNIQSFSMPSSAYINPTAYGDLTGINKWVWMISHFFADLKFMSLFSILFGAGIILLMEKLEGSDKPIKKIWYSRLFWLLMFGLAHAFLIWPGDILVMYAICGFLAYFLRKRSSIFLMRLAIVFFCLPVLLNMVQWLSWDYIPAEAIENINHSWNPETEEIASIVTTYSEGTYMERLHHRVGEYQGIFIFYFLFTGIWRILAMMLFGMYFYKKGALSAEWNTAAYKRLFYISFPLALVIISTGIWFNFDKSWMVQHSMFLGTNFNYVGSLFMAFSYLAIIMLWSKSDMLRGVQSLLQKVGKMAFTNYILMSVLCTTFFNRLGYFGDFSRVNQLFMTIVVWAIIFGFTHLWMARYKMGPLEWIWRSLTYWKKADI
ncbi:MAG: DUF418 domain-containing protein [Saprospiraceae bacterium]